MRILIITILLLMLSACGFHLQAPLTFSPPLKTLYISSSDPYGPLMRYLKEDFKESNVKIVDTQNSAETELAILSDTTAQELLSVSNTQQIRQYNLRATVTFEIRDKHGNILFGPESLSENSTITVQSNQILAGSNEIHTMDNQMRRLIASAMMYRLSSTEVSNAILSHYPKKSAS